MRPVTVQTSIAAPRDQVFDFVSDMANRVAFMDHYLKDFRLARANSTGTGAAARYRIKGKWAGTSIVECDRPQKIVEEGSAGRFGRTKLLVVWTFQEDGGERTRVELEARTEPGARVEALGEALGARGWLQRQSKKALERLRRIFEEPAGEAPRRATVAAYESATAPRYGA
jgi:carbon monoxide dehydrogenase subunit G